MAQIKINEVSQSYTYNTGTASYATVAMPITASWGPAFMDTATTGENVDFDDVMETVQWLHFPANSSGMDDFVKTYRGPSANYKTTEDYSYQMALTLLASGYDVLACRLCPGTAASTMFQLNNTSTEAQKRLFITAKYPGSFGNNLRCTLTKKYAGTATEYSEARYWQLITSIVTDTGASVAVENLIFVFDADSSTDTIPYIGDVKSNYITITGYADITNHAEPTAHIELSAKLAGGSDTFADQYEHSTTTSDTAYYLLYTGNGKPTDWENSTTSTVNYYTKDNNGVFTVASEWASTGTYYRKYTAKEATTHGVLDDAYTLAYNRYTKPEPFGAGYDTSTASGTEYIATLSTMKTSGIDDMPKALAIKHREWLYSYAFYAYYALTDKLNYSPQRVISPGWDDQDTNWLNDSDPYTFDLVSPLHKKLMQVAYYGRCATAFIDVPRSCVRKSVYNEDGTGYAQRLSAVGNSVTVVYDTNSVLYSTHSALFAPWGQYKLVSMGRQVLTSPSMLALLIQRAQILNQSIQYEWLLPTNRKHNLNIGEMSYKVPNKLMDAWQSLDGVGVNLITEIPGLGTNIWGNSTLFDVPPATYQALANLSTRFLVNAVENQSYKCGLAITFQYNNASAYANFYAGMTPLLDAMQNAGAIEDYRMEMAADIDGLAQVNANSVVGKIYLVIPGVINDITIDLIALPPGTDLTQFDS